MWNRRHKPKPEDLLTTIIVLLNRLVNQGEHIMADIHDVQAKLDSLITATAEERAEVQALLTDLRAEVKTLQDQIANGSVVSQADLDGIATKLDEALASVRAISEAHPEEPPVEPTA